MSEICELLKKTYSGTMTEEIKESSRQLDEYGCSVEFCQTLFTIILEKDFSLDLKISALLRVKYIVNNHWSIDIDENSRNFILSMIPILINTSFSTMSKIIVNLLSSICGQEFYSERWESFMTYVNEFKETNFLAFIVFHLAFSQMLKSNSLSETRELICSFVEELSEIGAETEDANITVLIIKTLKDYIRKDHSFYENINSSFVLRILLLFENYETTEDYVLCAATSFVSCIFKQLEAEASLKVTEILFNILPAEISPKLFKKCTSLLLAVVTRSESYESAIQPNIEDFVVNILFPYFKMTETESEESQTDISSFLASFQTEFCGNDNRTNMYLASSQASHDPIFSHAILQFTVELLQQTDTTQEDAFSCLFMLSSCIPHLVDCNNDIVAIIMECIASENVLIMSGALQCACKMYYFSCPIDFYRGIFNSLTNESILVRNYAIEAIQELLLNEPEEEISDLIRETFAENLGDFIEIIFQTSDEMNCPSLNLAIVQLISFFGKSCISISTEIIVRLFVFSVSNKDILSSYDSVFTTIYDIISVSEEKDEMINNLLPVIMESLQAAEDENIEKVFTLLANMAFIADESIDFTAFFDPIMTLVQKYGSTLQNAAFFFHNLFLRNPSFILPNFAEVFQYFMSCFVNDKECGLLEDVSPYLHIFAVMAAINCEIDIPQIISNLDQETFDILLQSGEEGPRLFFIIALEKTNGQILQSYEDIPSLFESFSFKATENEMQHLLEISEAFLDHSIIEELQQCSFSDTCNEDDLFVHLLPLF